MLKGIVCVYHSGEYLINICLCEEIVYYKLL